MDGSLDHLLDEVAGGRVPAAEAAERLRRFGYSAVGDYARLDISRAARKGVPEVVFAEGKTADQLVGIVARFLEHGTAVLCSRVSAAHAEALAAGVDGILEHDELSRVVVVRRAGSTPPETRGVVGLLAAGTSDLPAAGEAVAMCRAMDVEVVTAFDVGVAGALPSVVAGLVDVPVIGLPTSTGYGLGGRGEAALLGMLQSCSPGLVVVNIDNGIGAGATAALIARRAAQ
jgi:NCAIR mutase (PurE)-related protein